MSQRDELATPDEIEFWRVKAEEVGGVLGAHFHDALDRLVRASWSSRPQVVESVEELEALPEDSIVLDACGCAYRKDGPGRTVWLGFGDEVALNQTCVDLPATVLYVPQEAK